MLSANFRIPGTLLLLIALLAPTATLADRPLQPDPMAYVSPSRDFDCIHTKVDLDLDLRHKRISGGVTHTISPLKPGVRKVQLNCVGLNIESVSVNGKNAEYDYPVPGQLGTSWIDVADTRDATDLLVVLLDTAFAVGDRFDVTIAYNGSPTEGLSEKGIPEKRYEVWAQGEGEDNRYWIPSFDYPNDKATYEGIYRVDKGMSVVSNGILVEQQDIGDKTQFHWRLATPQVNYLITVGAGEYDIVEEKWRDIPLLYVVPPGTDRETVQRAYGLTPAMMEFFSNYIGIDYPFEKYAQITVQNFIYGGMENTGATVMNMRMLYDERAAATTTEQGLVAHELAHQWWGDMVTCAEWSHMWLNEGFATYFQGLFREHNDGDDAFRYQMDERHGLTVSGDDRDARPLVVDFYNRKDQRNSTNVYRKGASVLHMLRFLIGDELFQKTIQNYGEDFKYQVAETSDFAKTVKRTTGENLDWFFEQWVYLAGHPKLRVSKSWDPQTNMLTLTIKQTQKVDGLVPLFRLPMDIEITCDEKTETYRVLVDKADQDFHFNVPSSPRMVIVDKGSWTLKSLEFGKSTREWIYQIKNGDTMSRVRAARALAKKGDSESVVDALADVLHADDEFWGLRREAARALGKIGTAAVERALIAGLKADDGRVRKACAVAMGSLEASSTVENTLRDLTHNDFAYEVRSEAITALVKMRSDTAKKVCVEALNTSSYRGLIRRAALTGLADLEAIDTIDKVKALTEPGNRRTYRHTALQSYARLAKLLESDRAREKAADHLSDMLDDWYLRTRRQVITALGTLGEKRAVDDLRRVASNDPVASLRSRATRAADKLESASAEVAKQADLQADIKSLTQKIETLQAELKTLQARVPESGESEDLTRKDDDSDN
jgi:aminopeptidase N